LRIAARPVEQGQTTLWEHRSSLGVENDDAPASISSQVTVKAATTSST
jgi:hypothetical protein